MLSLLFKIITFPFWFPAWLLKTSIKIAFGAAILLAIGGYVYYAQLI